MSSKSYERVLQELQEIEGLEWHEGDKCGPALSQTTQNGLKICGHVRTSLPIYDAIKKIARRHPFWIEINPKHFVDDGCTRRDVGSGWKAFTISVDNEGQIRGILNKLKSEIFGANPELLTTSAAA